MPVLPTTQEIQAEETLEAVSLRTVWDAFLVIRKNVNITDIEIGSICLGF